MSMLNPKLVEHKILIKSDFKPYKQSLRRMSNEVILKGKEEVKRLLKVGCIRVAQYAEWLSNVVPVVKKNGKIRVCVDFRNLNTVSLNDEYVMPLADQLVDSVAGYKLLSFMDGNAGYHQIKIAKEDIPMTTFRCLGVIVTFE